MRSHLVVDNSVDGNSSTGKSLASRSSAIRYSRRIVSKIWSISGATDMFGLLLSGAAFILIGSLIFHMLPSEHPTFQDRKIIGSLIGVFGFGFFYLAGRRNLLAVPVLTGLMLLTHQYVTIEVAGSPFIGRDVILCSIIAVVLGGLVRMITPNYETNQ